MAATHRVFLVVLAISWAAAQVTVPVFPVSNSACLLFRNGRGYAVELSISGQTVAAFLDTGSAWLVSPVYPGQSSSQVTAFPPASMPYDGCTANGNVYTADMSFPAASGQISSYSGAYLFSSSDNCLFGSSGALLGLGPRMSDTTPSPDGSVWLGQQDFSLSFSGSNPSLIIGDTDTSGYDWVTYSTRLINEAPHYLVTGVVSGPYGIQPRSFIIDSGFPAVPELPGFPASVGQTQFPGSWNVNSFTDLSGETIDILGIPMFENCRIYFAISSSQIGFQCSTGYAAANANDYDAQNQPSAARRDSDGLSNQTQAIIAACSVAAAVALFAGVAILLRRRRAQRAQETELCISSLDVESARQATSST